MKNFFVFFVVLIMVLAFVAGCGTQQTQQQAQQGETQEQKPAEQRFLNIATGGTAGTYYPLGGAMADIWKNNIPGLNPSVQSTGAAVANVNMLKDGSVDVIFVQNDIAYYAFSGEEMFKDNKYEDIRGLASLYPETIQIVALKDKNIKTVADLKGKRVAVGAAGSGTEANARQILEAAGLSYNDINVQYLSFGDAANNMKDGNIDAAFVTAGMPTAAVTDISATKDINIVEIGDDIADNLIRKYPFYVKTTIQGGTYKGQDSDVKTVSVMSMLAVSKDMDEELAYNLVKSLFENTDRLKAAHAMGVKITIDTAKEGMSIDLHPGAAKYYTEQGK
ncbi:TAXI family TRAP transporter solute-binding subunit [Calorimonas adulescens]|uniref:TAXI family TRAP transporter solute-binding subunit n=1 Tax=Calorimonas adulescens TaxID=2606906 RepID=A0A5D8QGY2_9THEO|nr:TAXI family TRAP transporter solute-binding subunit [Calorimonas adulescens]TZE82793.1 TAXI family TRAP transporter solute-binding subunit [Calorimonas adulescens]